ncbi:Hypothetical protein PENO1_081670 [Penicillium occitanis (nom. inval.)]|nr:Hypothetical protein PENO1_081670 [Penicillium occitanis (nom. inval.)]PCG94156.1 hypothetical protein PENOC_084170 [Penicillium occitanis (nom. inval.)]
MPKKGGKKHNKKKGAGGGGAKVPDVKNVISPGHKEEDKLMYGEGTAAEATTTEAGPATASGSTAAEAAAPAAATAPETQEALAQAEPTAAVPEKEEELPVREKGMQIVYTSPTMEFSNQIGIDIVPTEAITEQRGDERTEALAATAPTGAKKEVEKEEAPREVAKETEIAEPELERPATSSSTERADLVAATQGKAEPAVAATTNGVAEVAKKEQVPTEETAGLVTAGGVGAAALAGEKTIEEGRTQPAPAALEKTETAKEAPAQPAEEKLQGAEVDTAAPLVAPHIKRAHEVPPFVTEERDQPSKKPRVDEPAEAQQKMTIPGRFPTPSVAGSTASGTDSAIASEAQNISKGETVAEKPETAGTVTAAPSTQPAATKGATEAAVTAPAGVPVATKDTKAEQISTADTGASANTATISTASPAGEISAQREPVLPVTPQKVDATAKPTSPAAAAAAAAFQTQPKPEQQQKQQEAAATKAAEEATPSKPAQQAPAQKEAKKGGFMAWIKRKFKGEKSTTATTNGNAR